MTSHRAVRFARRPLAGLALAAAVIGCANGQEPLPGKAPPAPAETGSEAEAPRPHSGAEAQRPAAKTEVFTGTGTFVNVPAKRRSGGGDGDVALDFAEAEIRDVVRTVLGEILKAPYSIDPQVQGKVTLKTNRPLRREDVVAALETALKANGAAIVLADSVYNVVPMAEAQKRVDGFEVPRPGRARLPGYGIEIVPLKYVAAAEMQKILQPVAPANGVLAADSGRNILFLAGSAQERAAMADTVRLFDVDYMKNMSYALVRPEHMDAAGLAAELKRVFENTAGANASLLRFVPLSRLNLLLAVSPRASYLKDVARWVERLDAPPAGPTQSVHYYRMQNAKAADVARALAKVYGGAGDADDTEENIDSAPEGEAVAAGAPPPAAPAPRSAPANGHKGSGPQIAVDSATNALIVRASRTEYAELERFLKAVDVAPDQVLIEVTIAEVTLNDTLKYGVEWFFRNADHSFQLSQAATVAPVFPGFNFTYTIPDVDVAVNALDSVTDVKVISAPKLLTLDNKTATLQVGDQVPVITQSATGIRNADDLTVVNAVQFRDTGIVLRVTPRIGRSGTVFVDVAQEVSNAIATKTSGIDSPTIQQRRLANSVAVQDGDTIALGGLIRQSDTNGSSGVPVLSEVPLLGKLFSSTEESSERTELLIFMRPRIVRNPAAAREVTEELRSGLQGLDALLSK